eukprot:CAMPEP_0119350324 /NCGR_PEP_ID=MMETSP1333-20130426/110002_1 /TAXON_ID=418940 /ORGANISM="Scyphosphaera apsteinii, Strain RCC1455" /LENGTH=75 /DNA_ID=CAMNT_0007362939 /DNA_START=1032 /DNA_END=1257 /DNA_ORIENTATION=-
MDLGLLLQGGGRLAQAAGSAAFVGLSIAAIMPLEIRPTDAQTLARNRRQLSTSFNVSQQGSCCMVFFKVYATITS